MYLIVNSEQNQGKKLFFLFNDYDIIIKIKYFKIVKNKKKLYFFIVSITIDYTIRLFYNGITVKLN